MQPLPKKGSCAADELTITLGCDQSMRNCEMRSDAFSRFEEEEDSGIKSGDIFKTISMLKKFQTKGKVYCSLL